MSKIYENKGWVYFIGEAVENKYGKIKTEYIKIGWTTNDPKIRLKALQTSNPRKLFILGTIKTNPQAEKMIHSHLKDARVNGEWFDFNKIKTRLVMWLPIYDFYDYELDCLCEESYGSDFFELKNKEKNKSIRKTLFEINQEDKNIFYWFPLINGASRFQSLLKKTTANKNHFDIIGDLIKENDDYYLIDKFGTDYAANPKISLSSLSIFKKFLEEFNLYENFKTISLQQKKLFNQEVKKYQKTQTQRLEKTFGKDLFKDFKKIKNA